MRLCLVLSVMLVLDGCFGYFNAPKFSSKESSSIEYFTKPTKRIKIPVMIHFDKALTDKLTKEYKIKTRRKFKDMSRSILQEVAVFFRHPSLNQSIQFTLLDTRFMRQSRLEMNDNGSIYLKNYCTRQGVKKKDTKKWWYSILLTGRDLFYLNGKGAEVRSSTARGYLGGICAIRKSCTIVEFNHRNIGFLLAHELGHSLGMQHDGPPHNECKPHRNIMSNKYHPKFHPKSWSRCSRKHLDWFMGTWKAWCLRNNDSEYENIST